MQRRMPKGTVAHRQIDPVRIEIPMDEINKGRRLVLQEGVNRRLHLTACSFTNSRNRPHRSNQLEQIAPLLRARINLWDDAHAEADCRISIRSAQTGKAEIEQNHLKGGDDMPRVTSYPQRILYRSLPNPEIVRLEIPMIKKDILLQKSENEADLSENL